MWEKLSIPWRCCLEEAWAAYLAGSPPIGAVIVDASGAIQSRGRNCIFDTSQETLHVRNHPLAHAELNALLALSPQINPRDCIIYTTLEPCPLCIGAICMMHVGEIRYAAHDPRFGSISLLAVIPYLQQQPIQVKEPKYVAFEIFAQAMLVEYLLRKSTHGLQVVDAWQSICYDAIKVGMHLFQEKTLQKLQDKRASAADVVNDVASTCLRDYAT